MITEPDITIDAGDGLVGYLLLSLLAAALGLGSGLCLAAWMASHWVTALLGS